MRTSALMAVCAAFLPATAAAADLSCAIETLCSAEDGCAAPEHRSTIGLRLVDGAVMLLTEAGEPAGFGLPALPTDAFGEPLDGMRAFAGPDGNGLVLMTLRDDGALTLSLHAGRMIGPPANHSTLAMGRCEVPA